MLGKNTERMFVNKIETSEIYKRSNFSVNNVSLFATHSLVT
jgi:hypothetical protein